MSLSWAKFPGPACSVESGEGPDVHREYPMCEVHKEEGFCALFSLPPAAGQRPFFLLRLSYHNMSFGILAECRFMTRHLTIAGSNSSIF